MLNRFPVVLAGIAVFCLSTGALAQTPQEEPGKDLFSQRCSVCHEVTNATTQHHTSDEWRAVIQRMVEHGAVADDKEQAAIIAYLAKNYGPNSASPASPQTPTAAGH
jgi:cytochrome c2